MSMKPEFQLPGLDSGTRLLTYYVDEFGNEHQAVHWISESADKIQGNGAALRAAAESYYKALGYCLLSLQLHIEEPETVLHPPAPRPTHLRMATSGGRRIFSADARALMESAGLDEAAVRRDVFGEQP